MCGYSKNFLAQGSSEKVIGSQKLLHWTAKDVANWIRTIDLDEYIGGLENAGIHGAVMVGGRYAVFIVMVNDILKDHVTTWGTHVHT